MNYSHSTMWWMLAAACLAFPSYVAVTHLMEGGMEPKEHATAVLHIAVLVIAALWAIPAKKFPGPSMAIAAMCGIGVFATAQFAQSIARPFAYVDTVLFLGLCIWAAMEVMERKNEHVGSYFGSS